MSESGGQRVGPPRRGGPGVVGGPQRGRSRVAEIDDRGDDAGVALKEAVFGAPKAAGSCQALSAETSWSHAGFR